jgi:predicted branched-subunit amino acid permease
VTDEVFFLAAQQQGNVSGSFFVGLAFGPYLGWSGGTLAGVLLGSVLPPALTSALGISLYAMFVAIIVPPAKKSRPIAVTVLIAVAFACLLRYLPLLRDIPSGWALIIAALAAASLAALLFPVDEEVAA